MKIEVSTAVVVVITTLAFAVLVGIGKAEAAGFVSFAGALLSAILPALVTQKPAPPPASQPPITLVKGGE